MNIASRDSETADDSSHIPEFLVDDNSLVGAVEILITINDGITLGAICKKLGKDKETIGSALEALKEKYVHGIELIELNDGFYFRTHPRYNALLGELKRPTKKLSVSLLQTLGVIALKQPITKSQIESYRRVDVGYALKSLLELELINVGHLDAPGKPLAYSTTDDFLKLFGLKSPYDIPVKL